MALKFLFYKNGEIELVDQNDKYPNMINKYIALWRNETEFKKAFPEGKR